MLGCSDERDGLERADTRERAQTPEPVLAISRRVGGDHPAFAPSPSAHTRLRAASTAASPCRESDPVNTGAPACRAPCRDQPPREATWAPASTETRAWLEREASLPIRWNATSHEPPHLRAKRLPQGSGSGVSGVGREAHPPPLPPHPRRNRGPCCLFACWPPRTCRSAPPLTRPEPRPPPRSTPWPASCRPASASCSSAC